MDARLFYVFRDRQSYSRCRWAPNDQNVPVWWRISRNTGNQICYSPEALLNAQSAYFSVVIMTQIANQIVCRTRVLSMVQQGLGNWVANFSFFIELCFCCLLIYTKPIAKALNTRAVASPHFAVPSMSIAVMLILYDETRKLFVRAGIVRDKVTRKFVYKGWVARNTLY